MVAILNKMTTISCVDKKRNNCIIGGHFENKMAAIALKFVVQI
jgi:hypothetical protein